MICKINYRFFIVNYCTWIFTNITFFIMFCHVHQIWLYKILSRIFNITPWLFEFNKICFIEQTDMHISKAQCVVHLYGHVHANDISTNNLILKTMGTLDLGLPLCFKVSFIVMRHFHYSTKAMEIFYLYFNINITSNFTVPHSYIPELYVTKLW